MARAQFTVVPADGIVEGQAVGEVEFYNPDGTPWSGGDSGGDVAWSDVTGKPATFPPSQHTHEIADVTGLQEALDEPITAGDVPDLPASKITSGTFAAARIPSIPVSGVTGLQGELDGKAAASHTHPISQVSGLQSALDSKADVATVTETAAALTLTASHHVVVATDPAATITLPAAVSGRIYNVVNSAGGQVTVSGSINGGTEVVLFDGDAITVCGTSTGYVVLSSHTENLNRWSVGLGDLTTDDMAEGAAPVYWTGDPL